ncbi:fungal-specific transcription factor domain-containing protein [Favolaschia claudopus]|uniref:Fungal-specific transcription factor domain-containing protein n=1 Tax=Favolaschia claudopus TaxID=2862362 RepID=A0AAV9Z9V4_9AGAR
MKLADRDTAFKSSAHPTTASLSPSSSTTTATLNSHSPSDGAEASLYIMRESLRAHHSKKKIQKSYTETINSSLGIQCVRPFIFLPQPTLIPQAGKAEEVDFKPWLGKSSSASLVKAVVTFKDEILKTQHWQRRLSPPSPSLTIAFDFPPQPLLLDLIDLYFTQINIYIPLLHRPTFERDVRSSLHLRYMNSFALESAPSPRDTAAIQILQQREWDADGVGSIRHSTYVTVFISRYPYILLIQAVTHRSPPQSATTYSRTQAYTNCSIFPSSTRPQLAVMFLEGSSAFQTCWTLVGFGFRLAQDIGIHRRTCPQQPPSVEGELYKRALWVLIYLDGQMSCSLGRTCGTDYFDIDIEPPLEVDDEYWEDPIHPFKQPHGVPSTVTFFNSLLQLNHILSVALTILYPAPKTRHHLAINSVGEESLLVDLDSALNDWLDRVPEHPSSSPPHATFVLPPRSPATPDHHLTTLLSTSPHPRPPPPPLSDAYKQRLPPH